MAREMDLSRNVWLKLSGRNAFDSIDCAIGRLNVYIRQFTKKGVVTKIAQLLTAAALGGHEWDTENEDTLS